MTRSIAFCLALFGAIVVSGADTELPQDDDYESFEVEPPILIPNRETNESSATQVRDSGADIDRLAKEVTRAEKIAQEAEHLFKVGVLAKVEVEMRSLRVLQLRSKLEDARLAEVREAIAKKEALVARGEISKADLSESEHQLAAAVVAAETAAANREKAEIAEAEVNVRRQQKLAAEGSARKSDVNRAEQKLAELKANPSRN